MKHQGNYFMQYLKKYNNFLLVIILGFYSLIIGSDYVPFSPSEVTETSRIIPTIFSENPTMALVVYAAAALLGSGMLYLGKDRISSWAERTYKDLEKKANQEVLNMEKGIENNLSWPTKVLMGNLRPIFNNTIANYIAYNKWPMIIAAFVAMSGKVLGYPIWGGCISGGILIGSHYNQGISIMREENKQMHAETQKKLTALKEENKQMHEKTQAKVTEIANDVQSVLQGLTDTKNDIQLQMTTVKSELSNDIKSVGKNVVDVGGRVDGFGGKILQLAKDLDIAQNSLAGIKGTNEEIVRQNNVITSRVEGLSKQLSLACDRYGETTQDLSNWRQIFTKQMENLTNVVEEKANQADQKVDNQAEELNKLRSDMKQGFEECFAKIVEQNQLLQSFNDAQQSHSKFTQLLRKEVADNAQKNAHVLEIVEKLVKITDERATTNATVIKELAGMCEKNATTMDQFCANMQSLDTKIAAMREQINKVEEKVDVNEENRKQDHKLVLARIESNSTDVDTLKRILTLQTGQMDLILRQNETLTNETTVLKQTVEELKTKLASLDAKADENIKLSQETNQIIKSGGQGGSMPLRLTAASHVDGVRGVGYPSSSVPLGEKKNYSVSHSLLQTGYNPEAILAAIIMQHGFNFSFGGSSVYEADQYSGQNQSKQLILPCNRQNRQPYF